MEKAFDRVPRVVEQVLQAALQHKNSLCFLTRISPGVHGADDELDSMGSSKVLLENDIVSSHEKRRKESS